MSGRPGVAQEPVETPAAANYKQHRLLTHAHELARQVVYAGKNHFIHCISRQQVGGSMVSTVWLDDGRMVEADQLTLAPEINE